MKSFDKEFKRTERAIGCSWVVILAVNVGIILFVIWVIVKLMQYFGVI